MLKTMAFTLSSQGLLKELKTDVLILSKYVEPSTSYTPVMWNALWDTGASRSTISQRVVDHLHLTPVGIAKVSTANGLADVKTYIVDIGLPNQVIVPNILVSCANLGDEIDALIGMDIITLGDFSITNVGGRTKLSYRIPSTETIDYVTQQPKQI